MFAPMSPMPAAMTSARADRAGTTGRRSRSVAVSIAMPDTARALSRGHRPLPGAVRESRMNSTPNAAPAMRARATPRLARSRRGVGIRPPSALTKTTATTASATPSSTRRPGRSPSIRPPATGTTVAVTAVTGATTLIVPRASAP